MAILVCAPLGSMLVSTFGDILLEKPFTPLVGNTGQTEIRDEDKNHVDSDRANQKHQDKIMG